MTQLFWLSDEAWARIEPHLPHGQPGKTRVDDRRVISGILHVLKVGRRWQDTPSAYGPHTTVYNRYNRWLQRGVWQPLFAKIAATGPVPDELMLDASHMKAHRSAARGNGGLEPGHRSLARRLHEQNPLCLADGLGRPVAFALTPGNVADITMPLLQAVVPPKRLIADKAYDAQSLRDWLKSHHPVHGHPDNALQAQPDRLPAAQSHRTPDRPHQKLAGRRDPLRSLGLQLSRCHRAGFLCHRMDLNESPT